MKVNSCVIFVILILLTEGLSGQTGFRPGYVITLSNDTLIGEIMFNSGQQNHKTCTFRPSKSGEKVVYTPSDITGYRFGEGKYYVSKRLPVYGDTLLLFAEFMLKGRASFYFVTLKSTAHYYIETMEGVLELTEPEITTVVNNTLVVKQSKSIGKLRATLSDCPEIMPLIDNVKMNHSSLISLGRDYHRITCETGDCIVFERTLKESSSTIGIITGYSVSDINFGNQVYENNVGSFLVGVTFEKNNLLANDERISLQADAYLQYIKTITLEPFQYIVRGEFERYGSALIDYEDITYYLNHYTQGISPGTAIVRTNNLEADISWLILKLPVTINYSFGTGKMHYSFGIGPLLSFTLNYNKNFDYRLFSEVYGRTIPFFLFGGVARAGLEYRITNNNTLFLRPSYDMMINIGEIDEITRFKFNSFSFNAGIRF